MGEKGNADQLLDCVDFRSLHLGPLTALAFGALSNNFFVLLPSQSLPMFKPSL